MSQSPQMPEVRQACLALAARFQTLHLGTVTKDGQPEASYAPYVTDQGFYYVYLSQLARHTGNLRDTGKASVMFIQPESEATHVFARERLTLTCEAQEHPRGTPRFEQVIRLFDERFGKFMQVIRPMQDFGLFELRPVKGSYVAGFARAYTLAGADLSHVEHRRDEGHRREDSWSPMAPAQEHAP
jgi:putative heme iron utilization protein